jgi:hypothetical protein
MSEDYCDDENCPECGTLESEDWMKKQTDYLKKIKKFKLKTDDRLHGVAELSFMHKILCDTVMSWSNWVNGWVSIELGKKIDVHDGTEVTISDVELQELHKKYKTMVTEFLEMDLKITDSFTKKIIEKQKKELKKNCLKPESKAMVV